MPDKPERKVRTWCPTCGHFMKTYGVNGCKLLDWSLNPLGPQSALQRSVLRWWKDNAFESTRIHDDAEGCPGHIVAEWVKEKGHA